MTHDHRRANLPQHANGNESLMVSTVLEPLSRSAAHSPSAALSAAEGIRRQLTVEHHVREEHLALTAHELRNPLTAISLQAQLALRHVQRDGHLDATDAERILRLIVQEAAQMATLLDLLLVAHPDMIYVLPNDQRAGA